MLSGIGFKKWANIVLSDYMVPSAVGFRSPLRITRRVPSFVSSLADPFCAFLL